MKLMPTLVFLSMLLGGCSTRHHRPADNDALHFVATQIHTHSQRIAQAQERLKQASATASRPRLSGHKPRTATGLTPPPTPGATVAKQALNKDVNATADSKEKRTAVSSGFISTKATTPVVKDSVKSVPKPIQAAKMWRAERGSTLKDTLYVWAAAQKCPHGQNATWNIVWATEINYRIDAPLSFSGSFREALNGVFRLYTTATVPLFAGINTPQCLLKVDDKAVR